MICVELQFIEALPMFYECFTENCITLDKR